MKELNRLWKEMSYLQKKEFSEMFYRKANDEFHHPLLYEYIFSQIDEKILFHLRDLLKKTHIYFDMEINKDHIVLYGDGAIKTMALDYTKIKIMYDTLWKYKNRLLKKIFSKSAKIKVFILNDKNTCTEEMANDCFVKFPSLRMLKVNIWKNYYRRFSIFDIEKKVFEYYGREAEIKKERVTRKIEIERRSDYVMRQNYIDNMYFDENFPYLKIDHAYLRNRIIQHYNSLHNESRNYILYGNFPMFHSFEILDCLIFELKDKAMSRGVIYLISRQMQMKNDLRVFIGYIDLYGCSKDNFLKEFWDSIFWGDVRFKYDPKAFSDPVLTRVLSKDFGEFEYKNLINHYEAIIK